MSQSSLSALGSWVADLDGAQLPPESLRAARYQILDTIAAAAAGSRSPEAASVLPGVRATAAPGGASVIGSAEGVGPVDGVFANAAWSMAQDFDNIVWMGHCCHSAVFAALAVAEHEGIGDGHRVLGAVVAANEVGGRLGASAMLGPLNGQMWTFLHLLGAAAATSSLLELDAERTTHAFAIALSQPTFALQPGFMTPSSKLLAASIPAATGVRAAYLAQAGMTGAPQILEDPRGFWARFSYLPLEGMLGGLGSFHVMQTLALKTYPGCHYFQTACTALEQILARTGPLKASDVRRIGIETTKLGTEATRFAGEYGRVGAVITPVNVNFDLGVTAAILLHAGRLTSDEVHPAWLEEHSPALRALRSKVEVRHAPDLTLRTLASMRAVPLGRSALDGVRPRDVVRLVRQYRKEYRSDLVGVGELGRWGRALTGRLLRGPGPLGAEGTVPLYFPARVVLELAGGRSETARVDLPVASFCSPHIEGHLRVKFLREAEPVLGDATGSVLRAGLALGGGALEDVVAPLRGSR